MATALKAVEMGKSISIFTTGQWNRNDDIVKNNNGMEYYDQDGQYIGGSMDYLRFGPGGSC